MKDISRLLLLCKSGATKAIFLISNSFIVLNQKFYFILESMEESVYNKERNADKALERRAHKGEIRNGGKNVME
jgi:hypothetical protein